MTYVDLQNRTQSVLQKPWSHLLVIAESGEWLTKPPIALERPGVEREVVLIEARQPPDDWPLRKKIGDALSAHWKGLKDVRVTTTDLSWWQHNRHLTLALTRNEASEFVCLGGIYFRRRHKASRIQPLYLDGKDPDDVAELLLTVLAYARRSLEELATPNGVVLARKVIEIAVAMADKGTASERIAETVRVLRAAIARVEAEGPGGN
jgi:hypothetical protein